MCQRDKKVVKIFTVFVLLIIITACSNTTEPNDFGRIIFGQSIDGVKIGDDSTTVIRKLGRPSAVLDGDFKGYRFLYLEGIHKSLEVAISETPALGLGVIAVSVDNKYSGKSIDGIGINSDRDYVRSKIGEPDEIDGDYDCYNYEKNSFGIFYVNQRIFRMGMSTPRLY